MPYTIILHIQNEDPVIGEVDELPAASDRLIKVDNPRRLDNKDLPYLAENVTSVLWPAHRLNFIEVVGGEDDEDIFGFVRE